MTDHPRFEPVRSAPDQAHLDYNGGRLVDAILRLVECWLALRESRPGLRGSADETLPRAYPQWLHRPSASRQAA
jgi:hypothetical protein